MERTEADDDHINGVPRGSWRLCYHPINLKKCPLKMCKGENHPLEEITH